MSNSKFSGETIASSGEVLDYWEQRRVEQKLRRREAQERKKETIMKRWEALTEEERKHKREALSRTREERIAREAQKKLSCDANIAKNGEIGIVVDLEFEEFMTEQQCKSTAYQVRSVYALCRATDFRLWPYFVGFTKDGALHKQILNQNPHHLQWPCEFRQETLSQIWRTNFSRLIYLTADSDAILINVKSGRTSNDVEDVIDDASIHEAGKTSTYHTRPDSGAGYCNQTSRLDMSPIYVVGGFVDRNRHKGATLSKARALGIRHARLPLQENLPPGGSNMCRVLTINHIVDTLARVLQGSSWTDAFDGALPQRCRLDLTD